MRFRTIAALGLLAVTAGSPALAQGILVATDNAPATQDTRGCMVTARKALSGTGMVIETAGASVVGSNDDRTITIRCDNPTAVFFVEAYFPGEKDVLDPIKAAFEAKGAASLVAAKSMGHQYTVDCTRQTSCAIDAPAVCRQAYAKSAKPSAKVMSQVKCADAQGQYTCSVDYDLNCG